MSLWAIVCKENRVLLRSRRARLMAVAYVGLFAFLVLWSWPRGDVLTLAALASQRVIYVVGLGQLVLLLFIMPGVTAASIVRERHTGALELLQVSRLSPATILLGKWFGCAAFALLLLLSSMPCVVLCMMLGTLDGDLLASIYAHLVTTVFWAAMIGIGVSSLTRTVDAALMASYLVILAVSVVPIVPSVFVPGAATAALGNVSPIAALVSLTLPDAWLLVRPSSGGPSPLMVFMGFGLASGAIAGVTALFQLSRRYQPRVYRHDRLIEERSESLARRRRRFPFYLIDPLRRRRPIADWGNPVFAKEVRSRALGHATTFIRVFYAVLILSLALTVVSVMKTGAGVVDSVRVVAIATQVLLIGLVAPPLTAPAISSERERGTLDLLRLTSLGPLQLVAGKGYYALMVSSCVLAAAIPMWFVIFGLQQVPASALWKAISVVLAALFCGTLGGMFASSLCKRTGAATGAAYCVTLGALAGTLAPVALIPSLSDRATAYCLALNPVVAAVATVSLTLFRNGLQGSAWKMALVFLVASALVFFAGSLLMTRRLFRRN